MDINRQENRQVIDDLLSSTFDLVLRVEEKSLSNRLTEGLTINEIHTIAAVGYRERDPMNVVATRLGVTLATLNSSVNRLVKKGYIERSRDENDRRRVLISLTHDGRQVYRAHSLFHKKMVDGALDELTPEEETVLARALFKLQQFFKGEAEA